MTFDETRDLIDELIRNGLDVSWEKAVASKCDSDEYRNGVFYVYDKNGQVVYIGMAGNGRNTSLYRRCSGHGWGSLKDGAHRKLTPARVSFRRFAVLDRKLLSLVKALALSKVRPKGQRFAADTTLRKREWKVVAQRLTTMEI